MATAKKERDRGHPTVRAHFVTATPELVERTRRNFNAALDVMYSAKFGAPVHLKIEWGKKPENYGKETVTTLKLGA